MVPVARPAALSRRTPSTGRTCPPTSGVGIVLEDHYWDDSDAAVVFKRFDRRTGDTRYVYHGNDGTSFPWNDTAQLDFLDAAVREQVIQTILAVARRFPIIRFDAAMVLAKKHIERLWWPEPGQPGGIPSRAEHAMPKREFDKRMPVEFWREVVDRVAAEVPDTLLLAEAFWLLEGYFVRTLGMHRVYNSAFMHMLRDEDGAGYRKVIKDTLEFDPEILKRYVNFMSNPDEKTALEQFGKGDKYFGVAMVLATLPGLPMLGHGQVQGFSEKYGMEFRRATLDEQPDPWLLERHEREIFPLLHRRAWFAEAKDFLLYDLITERRPGRRGRLRVLERLRPGALARRVPRPVRLDERLDPGVGAVRPQERRTAASGWCGARLAEGLGIPNDPGVFVAFRDARSGLESLRSARELWERGLYVSLDAYGGARLLGVPRDPRRGGRANGRGWPRGSASVRCRRSRMRCASCSSSPSMRRCGRSSRTGWPAGPRRHGTTGRARRAGAPVRGVPRCGRGGDRRPGRSGGRRRRRPAAGRGGARGADLPASRLERAALLAWLALSRTGELAPGADVAATSRAWYDELRLPGALAAGLREAGLDEGEAWTVADQVRVLLTLPRPSELRGPGTDRGRAAARPLAGQRHRPDRDRAQHLGRRRVARSRPVRDTARLGPPARRHRGRTEPPGHAGRARRRARLMAAAKAAGYRLDRLTAALGRDAGRRDRAARAEGRETRRRLEGPARPTKASPTMTALARRFRGVVHWPRRLPRPTARPSPHAARRCGGKGDADPRDEPVDHPTGRRRGGVGADVDGRDGELTDDHRQGLQAGRARAHGQDRRAICRRPTDPDRGRDDGRASGRLGRRDRRADRRRLPAARRPAPRDGDAGKRPRQPGRRLGPDGRAADRGRDPRHRRRPRRRLHPLGVQATTARRS